MKTRPILLFISFLLVLTQSSEMTAQVEASGHGFNYFDREAILDVGDGAGFSFYAAVWPIMQKYPGAENFQLGLPSTWLRPSESGNEPENFYNTIEGGLGWWHDTRFGTETAKFIMGGVAFDFNQWANGTGAGSTDLLDDGHRDWSEPGGKYGVAQLSQHLLWPPDGLNMEQGANGAFLGYGYHPLPITDELPQTYGQNFATGNQCWTLFLNSSNFKGPATFFIPTFWTETVLDNPSLEGLFFDSRSSDKNPAFAMEYAQSPALMGTDNDGNYFAKVLPLVFPDSDNNRSELIRDITVYSKAAKWDAVQSWFNGGAAAATSFDLSASDNIFFDVDPFVDGQISTQNGGPLESDIDYDFAEKIMSADRRVAGFEWDPNIVSFTNGQAIMPEYYQLNSSNLWDPVNEAAVPPATGLLTNEPTISPRNEDLPYLTPLEPDCHLQDPQSPWRSPGPVSGPYKVDLGDGSTLTYYWYRFIDQPAIIHANLPEAMRQNMQERVEKIHRHWHYTEEYLPAPSGGELVGLDTGLIVNPPKGLEIGYVPIVTRQEKSNTLTATTSRSKESFVRISPVPTNGTININGGNEMISQILLYNSLGELLGSWPGINENNFELDLSTKADGIYFITVFNPSGSFSTHPLIKKE